MTKAERGAKTPSRLTVIKQTELNHGREKMKKIFASFLIVALMMTAAYPIGIFAADSENTDETILEIINSQGEFTDNINKSKNYTGVMCGNTKYAVSTKTFSDENIPGIEWIVRGTAANGGRLDITLSQNTDLSEFMNETYFETGIYCDAAALADLPSSIRLVDANAKYIEAPIEPFELNAHRRIRIKLSDFAKNSGFAYDKVRRIRFMLPEKLSGEGSISVNGAERNGWFHIYTDNMRIARENAAELNALQQGGAVVLSVATNCKDGTYRFYCGDSLLAETEQPSYEYKTNGTEGILDFRAEVYAADGTFFAKDEKKIAVYKADAQSLFTVVGNDGVFAEGIAETDVPNNRSAMMLNPDIYGYWKGYKPELSDFAVLPLEKSQKWVVHGTEFDSAMWRIHFNSEQDFSEIRTGGYLSFLIYCNAASVSDLPTQIALYNDEDVTHAAFPRNIKLNEWNLVKVYFQDFRNIKFDFEHINRIEMSFPAALSGEGDYDGAAEHKGWYDLYIGNMYVGADLDFSPKTYAQKPMISDSEYSELFDNSVIFAVGARNACVNGLKREIAGGEGAILIESKAYIPSDAAAECFGMALTDSVKLIYHNGVGYAAADDVARAVGKTLTEKNGVFAFANSKKELTSGKAAKIAQTLMWDIGHMNNGAEGFVTGMIIHPKEPSLMYCRTDVGGCYRWDDDAQIWRQLMTVIPNDERNLVGVQSIALDPNNTDVVYALCGTFSGAVPYDLLKSEDRGETWQRTYLNKSVVGNITRISGERVAVDPNNSDIVWVGTNSDGLWYSENGGKTWKKNTAIGDGVVPYGINIVLFDEGVKSSADGRSTHIYVSSFGEGLYESTDGGKSFVKIEGTPEQINRMHLANGRLYFAAMSYTDAVDVSSSGLFYLENGVIMDITPTADENPAPSSPVTGFSDIIVDYTNPNYLVAAGRNGVDGGGYRYRFRSKDGGKTWDWFRASEDIGACQLLQDLRDPKRVYDIHGRGLWMYENIYADTFMENGWRKTIPTSRFQDGIYEDVALKTVSLPSEDAPMLLIGDYDAGYMYSEDKETLAIMQDSETDTWVHYGMTLDVDYCEEQPKYNARVGRYGQKGYVVLSDKYGRLGNPATGWDTSLHPFACAVSAGVSSNGYPTVIVAATSTGTAGGALYRSADWGKTWTKISGVTVNASDNADERYRDYVLISDSVDINTFYYCDSDNFYTSTDGGTAWRKAYDFAAGISRPTMYAYPDSEGEVWLCGNGRVYISKDRGTNWTESGINGEIKYLSFGKGRSDKPALYAYGKINGAWGVYMSDDDGEYWERMDDDGRNYAVAEITQITGDTRHYGRAFVSTGGYGVLYLEKNTENFGEKLSTATVINQKGDYPLSGDVWMMIDNWRAVDYAAKSDMTYSGSGISSKWTYNAATIGKTEAVIQIRMKANEYPSVSKDAALEFKFYTDAGDNALLPNQLSIATADGKMYNYFITFKDAVCGKWNYVSIPLSDFGITDDVSINRVEFLSYKGKNYSGDFSLYFDGMRFASRAFTVNQSLLNVGDVLRVSANAGENKSAKMLVAAYDKNGVLIYVRGADSYSAEHTVSDGEKVIKTFLFDGLSGIKPLVTPYVIDVEN